jgi:hypothetical protein
MRRLEFTRVVRGRVAHARNAAEAVMHLAQFARERHRLQQEREVLTKRLLRIDARLTEIVGSETRLAPMAQFIAPNAQTALGVGAVDGMLQY